MRESAARGAGKARARAPVRGTAFAVSAALPLAGAANVHPAHAQMTTQLHTAAPQAQTQQFGTTGQHRSGAMAPSQTQSYGATGQMSAQGQAPQSSYSSSCNDVRMQGQTLIAFCQKPDGTWQTSAIGPVSRCAGDIQNVNGQLTCSESGVGSSTPPVRSPSTRTQPKS